MRRSFLDKVWVRAAMSTVGVLMMVASINYFFLPNKIAPGGFSGIGTLLYYQFGLPVGLVSLALNVPLFLVALKEKGLGFILHALAATAAYSLLLDFLPVYQLTDDYLLASVYGGGLMGVGLGLIVRAGGSTGGTDMLARLICDRLQGMSFGLALFIIEAVIIGASGLMFGPQVALYAVLIMLMSSKIIDVIQEGLQAAKAVFIISDQYEKIGQAVLEQLERGVTALSGQGLYTRQSRNVLFCVVERSQMLALKNLIYDCDPDAFVIVSDVHEVLGHGFAPMPQATKKKQKRARAKKRERVD